MIRRPIVRLGATLFVAAILGACTASASGDCTVQCNDAEANCVKACNDDQCKSECTTQLNDCTASCSGSAQVNVDGGS